TRESHTFAVRQGRGMTRDHRGLLWIVTEGNGLTVFDPKRKACLTAQQIPAIEQLKNRNLKTIFVDHHDNKWVMAMTGEVYLIDPQGALATIDQMHGFGDQLNFRGSSTIRMTDDGSIWYANNDIIQQLIPHQGESQRYDLYKKHQSLPNVRCLLVDRDNNIWFGTSSSGVYMFPLHTLSQRFSTYSILSYPIKLSNPSVLSVLKINDNQLLAGTDWGGLNVLDLRRNSNTILTHNDKDPGSLPNNAVTALSRDSRGRIWVGTYAGGVAMMNPSTMRFTSVASSMTEAGNRTPFLYVTAIYEDKHQNLWVTTNGDGIYRKGANDTQFTSHLTADNHPPGKSLSTNNVLQIVEDAASELWIATYYGLNRYHVPSGRFEYYFANEKQAGSISHNWVLSLLIDKHEQLWVGTANGLNRFDRTTGKFTVYNTRDGLPGNIIQAMTLDSEGQIWISTNNGLARMNPRTHHITTWNKADGLTGDEFNPRSVHVTDDGLLMFGSTSGLNVFDARHLRSQDKAPAVVFTSLKAQFPNSPDKQTEHYHPTDDQPIEIAYNHANIEIRMTMFNYSRSEKIHYLSRIEGIDTTWTDRGNTPTISFAKLPYGRYTVMVKARLTPTMEGPVSRLHLHVMPPWWLTAKGGVLYVLIVLILLWLYTHFSRRANAVKNRLRMGELQQQQTEAVYRERLHFFSGVSHELKTPLSLILSSTRRIATLLGDNNDVNVLKRNAEKLQRRIEQLLVFHRMYDQKISINRQPNDLMAFVRLVMQEFEPDAVSLRIRLSLITYANRMQLCYDTDVIDKIVSNLLSNAFKFTPEGGEITVTVKAEKDPAHREDMLLVTIAVSDTGCGIASEDLPHVFDRLYTRGGLSNPKGTGIGLALSKELAQALGGHLMVESIPQRGSTFTLTFPAQEGKMEESDPSAPVHEIIFAPPWEDQKDITKPLEDHDKEHTLLIIDDNTDMRNNLRDLFLKDYNILTSNSGTQGVSMALDRQPDLIITDVMMPGMNGYELCKAIRENLATSHIPIIIVTALESDNSIITALEHAADDVITKPFNAAILELKVRNLVNRRLRADRHIHQDAVIDMEAITNNALDKRFMTKLIDLIEMNADNPRFGIPDLIREMGLSKSVFYRKVKSMTNRSVVELIHAVRLKKAARLLGTTEASVNDVALQSGFNDTGYFIKVFKEHYDSTPGEWRSLRSFR
ncbi:MAG: response regulator, partial [Marinilabiliaceae bacterium]|nr:response regulator [Marinilabiliaceae bacterium]